MASEPDYYLDLLLPYQRKLGRRASNTRRLPIAWDSRPTHRRRAANRGPPRHQVLAVQQGGNCALIASSSPGGCVIWWQECPPVFR
jgi:hypothetical protein